MRHRTVGHDTVVAIDGELEIRLGQSPREIYRETRTPQLISDEGTQLKIVLQDQYAHGPELRACPVDLRGVATFVAAGCDERTLRAGVVVSTVSACM